jgi:hypothetical protein
MATATIPATEKHMSRYSIALLAFLVNPSPAATQIPDTFTNLQVLDEDIPRDSLIEIMRGFSFALGVRCEHCHVLREGGSFGGADFAADDKLPKARARFMLRMVEQLNGPILAGLPMDAESDPPVAIECKTCHRARPRPVLLHHELQEAYEAGGAERAQARYRELREDFGLRGAFDFGEWEFTEWARRLTSTEDAAALLAVNFEFHPSSRFLASLIAANYEELGDIDQAIAWMEKAVEIAPDNASAVQELERLRGLQAGEDSG